MVHSLTIQDIKEVLSLPYGHCCLKPDAHQMGGRCDTAFSNPLSNEHAKSTNCMAYLTVYHVQPVKPCSGSSYLKLSSNLSNHVCNLVLELQQMLQSTCYKSSSLGDLTNNDSKENKRLDSSYTPTNQYKMNFYKCNPKGQVI